MGRGSSIFGGAVSGAQLGSAFGPWGTGIGAAIGGIAGIFGGGKSPEEELALRQYAAQMERANRFWRQASGNASAVEGWARPILGGSRTAAMEAMSPEIQPAMQRIEASRQSLMNLTPRSGGAAARLDPYAKSTAATNIMLQARPMAAQTMMDLAKTRGSWAQGNMGGPQSVMDYEKWRQEGEREKGKGTYDTLSRLSDTLGDWWGNRKKKGGSGHGFADFGVTGEWKP